jgi:hypothetical protein
MSDQGMKQARDTTRDAFQELLDRQADEDGSERVSLTDAQPDIPGGGFPSGIVPEGNLIGSDGNAFYVLGKCRREAIRAGVPTTEIADFCDEAMSGNYDHLLATTMRYFEVN